MPRQSIGSGSPWCRAASRPDGQWWQRAVRTGHGFAQVGRLHPGYFRAERMRVLLYALTLPLAVLLAGLVAWWLAVLRLGAYALSYVRSLQGLRRDGLPQRNALMLGALLVVSKFPHLLGMARFHLRRLSRAPMRIIEYT